MTSCLGTFPCLWRWLTDLGGPGPNTHMINKNKIYLGIDTCLKKIKRKEN